MTSTPSPAPFVSSRRIRLLAQTLMLDDTFVYLFLADGTAGIFRSVKGVSTLIVRVTRADVEALTAKGIVVERSRSRRGVRYAAAGASARAARRRAPTAADRRKARFLEAERFFQDKPDAPARAMTVNLGESPLGWLSRRKDARGRPFLSAGLVEAGERLRADFERAQLGPSVTQDWRRFLTPGGSGTGASAQERVTSGSAEEARLRVMDALAALGPGLSDAVLRTCCFLEGLEAVEERMDWSARSGKIVLKIALQRLQEHYEERDRDAKHGEVSICAPSAP